MTNYHFTTDAIFRKDSDGKVISKNNQMDSS